ncbi:MAG TPA: thioredoxin family protein [Bacteroidetes bacterium]|nr:thioredoxin family protein [Bacteroidota bacterium]
MLSLLPPDKLTDEMLQKRGDVLLAFPGYDGMRREVIRELVEMIEIHGRSINAYILSHHDDKMLERFRIQRLPALLIYRNGEEFGRFVLPLDRERLLEALGE